MKKDNFKAVLRVLRILGALALAVGVWGIILSASGFGDFSSNDFMIGGFMATFGIFLGVSFLAIGFTPSLARFSTKLAKTVQRENADDIKEIATGAAKISEDAIEISAAAVKRGLSDTCFCKECGEKIDADSKFCKKCGTAQ